MKQLFLLALLILLSCVSANGQDCTGAAALQKHVYSPERLVQQQPCITVKGTIRAKIKEKDGDFHVRLELDADQPKSTLLNARNIAGQHGYFVFEPICVNNVTQQTAKKACNVKSATKHWKQKISLPNVGDHVEVTGVFVLDTDPGHGWFEIHPVTSITKLD